MLSSVYKVPKAEIIEDVAALACEADDFAFFDRGCRRRSPNRIRGTAATDFSDYLIGATAARAGAATTYTFDRALRHTAGFSIAGVTPA